MNNLFDALEICLREIEDGADLDSVLLRYPDLAEELRPILVTTSKAKELSVHAPAPEVVRRNRAKVLQRAAEMKEATRSPKPLVNWFASLRRLASLTAVLAVFLASGTSLVGASSTSVPGDRLYGVKRSWEGMQVFFAFNTKTREALEVEHENERLQELHELFRSGRSTEVDFNGVVTGQTETGWLIAGIPVIVAPQTDLPGEPVQVNAGVRVVGITQADGSVLAEIIELLPPGATLPDAEREDGIQPTDNIPSPTSENEAPEVKPTREVQEPESEVKFNGVLDVLDDKFWTVNGVRSDLTTAEVEGTPVVGASVTVEGYFNETGVFVVTKIKFEETKSDGNSGSGAGSSHDGNANENSDDSDVNGNDGDHHDGGNENGSSGSGGGGGG